MFSIPFDKSNAMKDNAIIATQKLIERLKIKVTGASIQEQLQDHPDYPSLFSISDTLRDWHLNNAAVEIDPAQLQEIEQPFLAHIDEAGGMFVVVDKVGTDAIEYYHSSNGQVREQLSAFLAKFTGVVLIPFPEEHSGEDAYKEKQRKQILNALRVPALVAIAAFVLSGSLAAFGESVGWGFISLVLLKGIGLAITSVLLSYEFAKKDGIVNKVCGNKSGGCKQILNSKASKILGVVSWSELGFLYFSGGLLLLFIGGEAGLPHLKALNMITLAFSLYSLIYQGVFARQWCYFCLATLGIFWLEFAGLFTVEVYLSEIWSMPEIYLSGMAFALPLGLWIVMKPLLVKSSHLDYYEPNFKKLKYNTNIFQTLLEESETIPSISGIQPLEFGTPGGALQLTMVSNPFCGPCADAHHQVDHIIERFEEEGGVGFSLVFGVGKDASAEKYQVARDMIGLYYRFGPKASLRAISDWYSMPKKDYTAWREKYNPPNSPRADAILAQHQQWREDNDLAKETPVIIVNGHRLPPMYNVMDLRYFVQ